MDFHLEEPDDMSHTLTVLWTIEPQTPPRPWLACSRCRRTRPFECSGKTRLNANGRRLDAWLIYRCADCDGTWNRPIFERRSVCDIAPETLDALQNNDSGWIRQVSFDVEGLRRNTDTIEEFAECRVTRRVLAQSLDGCTQLEIVLAVPLPIGMRTDRLLSAELGLSRNRLVRLEEAGRFRLQSGPRKALQRPIRDGMRVILDLANGGKQGDVADRATGRLHSA
ncbi:hypothetical protein BHMPCIPO_01837 [Ensifer sesbaniae]|nr:hypothetical protein [Ensifer sesbaniae]